MTTKSISDFPIIPASKQSIVQRKPIHGVGLNDADYVTFPKVDGVRIRCQIYKTWKSMIERCYSEKVHKKRPTYKNCIVSEEWHLFSDFRTWMLKQDWQGNHLDKDILVPGNKLYSPERCLFVSLQINNLLNDNTAQRGIFPKGVRIDKRYKTFVAEVSINGRQAHIGRFKTIEAAECAYKKAKSNEIMRIAGEQADPALRFALARHAILAEM